MSFLDNLMAFIGRLGGKPSVVSQPLVNQEAFMQGLNQGSRPQLQDLQETTEAETIVKQICTEAKEAAVPGEWRYDLGKSVRWRLLKDDAAELQIAVMLAALDVRPQGGVSYSGESYQIQALRTAVVSQILRRNLPFTEADIFVPLKVWSQQRYVGWGVPGKTVLGALERLASKETLSQTTIDVLKRIKDKAVSPGVYGWGANKETREIAQRIESLLKPGGGKAPEVPDGPFSRQAKAWLVTQPESVPWRPMLLLAHEAGDKAKPSGKWLASMKAAIDAVDEPLATDRIIAWMADTIPDPARPDASLDMLKGLIWASTCLDHATLAGPLGRFAETCYRKVPGVGARSVKLGNAALWALSDMAGEPRASAELIRLREKIKYPSARRLIDNRLGELANKAGQTVQGLEDQSLPDFGLSPDGRLVQIFGGAKAELELSANDVTIHWTNSAGQPVKSAPADTKRAHVAEFAAFRTLSKDIEAARSGQVTRLEQSWVENRDWTFGDWETHFLNHPVRRPIAESLIWRVEDAGGSVAVLPRSAGLRDKRGTSLTPAGDARIRLWHPLHSDPDEVLAWRKRIVDDDITQPFKQAHREIYVLTEAERRTGTYSNRFAAHILRQHQFRALCQARGWTYGLMGGWDGWNVPERRLPAFGMHVQYQVEVIDDGQRSDAYVALHVASDQVRFLGNNNQPMPLANVPPIVFSELLRDVDLFVAVTSIANDPNWTDGGPNGRHGGYWAEWAFGELAQNAQTRKELISSLVPRLSIRDKLEITDKFLVVQGKRQKYAIHFGSSNIQILPSNRYLCIVPEGAPAEARNLKLPFAGDGLLSIILSKAFLLSDESKIKDETILRQL